MAVAAGCGSADDLSSSCAVDISTGASLSGAFELGPASQIPRVGQSFQLDTVADVTSVMLFITKVSSPTGTLKIDLYGDSSSQPNEATSLAQATLDLATEVTSGWNTFTFTSVSLAASTTYWIVLSHNGSNLDGTNFVRWYGSTSDSYTDGGPKMYRTAMPIGWVDLSTSFPSTKDVALKVGCSS